MSMEQLTIPGSEEASKHHQGNVKRTQKPSLWPKMGSFEHYKDNLINIKYV